MSAPVQRLLLLEDDDALRRQLERGLSTRGYQVHAFADLVTATGWIRTSTALDAAVLDLMVQDQSALPLVPEIRTRFVNCRMLVLTGYASIASTVKAIKAGADNYLAKPATLSEILHALATPAELPDAPVAPPQSLPVRRLEWEYIQRALDANGGNVSRTARQLGMHRRTLQRKLRKRPVAEAKGDETPLTPEP